MKPKIGLYNKLDSWYVVGVLSFLHVLTAALCVFFIYRFMIVNYDSEVWVLLLMFIVPLVIIDVGLYRFQLISRFLIRCYFDEKGIHCVLGLKKWNILWDDICFVGVTGFSATGVGIIFLSTDKGEYFNKKKAIMISDKRIVFEANDKIWSNLSTYMPPKMRDRLQKAINERRECDFRV